MQLHRKLWEFCIIAQVYHERISRGGAVLGFGVGLEPLAAWFANRNAAVIATDRPDDTEEWDKTNQHAKNINTLRRPLVCPDALFDERVRFMPINMNDIPSGVRHGVFDFTWSSGSFEHLGSIEHGLDFFCKQMECLKPGGLAVHTTEYNPKHSESTLNAPNLVLFRAQELHKLSSRLEDQGDYLWQLDLRAGSEEEDAHIDEPPYGLPHLSLKVGPFTTTSIVLIAQRGHLG
jgi:SAM-dependent methyltransferase